MSGVWNKHPIPIAVMKGKASFIPLDDDKRSAYKIAAERIIRRILIGGVVQHDHQSPADSHDRPGTPYYRPVDPRTTDDDAGGSRAHRRSDRVRDHPIQGAKLKM